MRCLIAAAGLLLLGAPSPAHASRAEVEGRGLPPLLAPDLSLVRLLPASAGAVEPQGLVDYAIGDPFVMAVGGRGVRYAYFLDDATHNLLLASPSGWGFTVGYSEVYSEAESHDYLEISGGAREEFTRTENEKRELRVGLGWRRQGASGRVLEIGLGGSYLDWDNETRGLTLEDDGPVMETEGGWSSDHALGFDAAVRSLSPDRGLQVALYFSYANLRPVTKTPFTVGVKRRRASVDVGWRLTTPKTDDLVLGFTASWQTDTDLRVTQWEVYDATSDHEEVKLGKLGVFLSGEREVLEGLRIRGGVRGLISFRDVEEIHKTTYSGVDRELHRDTFNASIDSPVFYLGAGYRWRGLDFEARVRESVNLDAPVTRWSVGMTF